MIPVLLVLVKSQCAGMYAEASCLLLWPVRACCLDAVAIPLVSTMGVGCAGLVDVVFANVVCLAGRVSMRPAVVGGEGWCRASLWSSKDACSVKVVHPVALAIGDCYWQCVCSACGVCSSVGCWWACACGVYEGRRVHGVSGDGEQE